MKKGQKMTKEQVRKLSLINPKPWLGKKFSDEHRRKISEARKGFKMSDEQRKKLSEIKKGCNHPNWKGGVKLENQKFRVTREYREFLSKILLRDGDICKIDNKDCGGPLEIHHILNSMDYPELRYEVNNGITLCRNHHPRGRLREKQLIPTFKKLLLKQKIYV